MPPKSHPCDNIWIWASQFLKEKPPDFLKKTMMSKIIVKRPCTFSLKEKKKVWKTGQAKSYSELSEACVEIEIINS